MITRTKQNWSIGQKVKVGFLWLTITAIELTPGDFRPDVYHLIGTSGKSYTFTPHFGLQKA
jgi:hypothetical protein